MRRLLFLLPLLVLSLFAANSKLYLKDGSFHIIREYSVEGDRIRYYSIERSDWEEIPTDLVDLKRTSAEAEARKEVQEKQAKAADDESLAAKEQRDEIRKIPQDPGLYRLENNQLRIFKEADWKVHNAKGRQALKILTPVGPMLNGKSTMEIAGEHASGVVADTRPEFFLQLAQIESFAIVKVTPQKEVRVVERLTTLPADAGTTEERDAVEIFSKQLTEGGLYKIWPQETMPPGEYAVIEYIEGKLNQRIWDFRIQ